MSTNYEILDDNGDVINLIIADLEFVEEHYPGHYREVIPPPPPVIVPQTVSPLQAKAELLSRGLLDEVETIVNASPDPIVPLAWTTASEFNRQSPMVLMIGQEMGWDAVYLDDLFTEAAKRVF